MQTCQNLEENLKIPNKKTIYKLKQFNKTRIKIDLLNY